MLTVAAAAVHVVRPYCARYCRSCPCCTTLLCTLLLQLSMSCEAVREQRFREMESLDSLLRSCPPGMPRSRRRRRQRRRRRLSAATPKPALGAAGKLCLPIAVTAIPQGHTERTPCFLSQLCLMMPMSADPGAHVSWMTFCCIVLQVGLQRAVAGALNRRSARALAATPQDCVRERLGARLRQRQRSVRRRPKHCGAAWADAGAGRRHSAGRLCRTCSHAPRCLPSVFLPPACCLRPLHSLHQISTADVLALWRQRQKLHGTGQPAAICQNFKFPNFAHQIGGVGVHAHQQGLGGGARGSVQTLRDYAVGKMADHDAALAASRDLRHQCHD